MILGLDVSTSTIGWCVLDSKGGFIDCGFIPLSKSPTLISKAKLSSAEFCKIFLKYPVEKVYIEECLQRFTRGMSSAATITKLASFNGIIQYVSYEDFGVDPRALLEYLAEVRTDLREQLLTYSDSIEYHYDWSLNDHRATRD